MAVISTKNRDVIEYVRLTLLAGVLSVNEARQLLYDIIAQEQEPNFVLIDAVASESREIIIQHLRNVTGNYNSAKVEGLIASELLKRYRNNQIGMPQITLSLYVQLHDKDTICWQADHNAIMQFDDGFNLINYGIGNEIDLSWKVITFLENKIRLLDV